MAERSLRLELITTGSELLLGQTLNTHVLWLGRELLSLGYYIRRQVCVPDGDDIRLVMAEAMTRCDILVVTGGLGPTSDDITREVTADLLGLPLDEDPVVYDAIRQRLSRRGREMNDLTRRQAMVPRGATVLANPFGTAPGLYLEAVPPGPSGAGGRPHLFLLPGPPRELHPMFHRHVAPRLGRWRPGPAPVLRQFKLWGRGESEIAETLDGELRQTGISDLGYCVRPGEVIIRCIGDARQIDECGRRIAAAFPDELFSCDERSMEEVVVDLLRTRAESVATAESCTGGMLADRLTSIPGASDVFGWGVVVYANAAKERLLGVPGDLIASRGAVSEEVAEAMAAGARRISGATWALAITGIAGPGGGTPEKPVGTVFIALAGPDGPVATIAEHFRVERETFKALAAQTALDTLRRHLARASKGLNAR